MRGWIFRWHRHAGAVAAGFLIFLLCTGVPLQFSDGLALGQRYISSDALLNWYGLKAPDRVVISQDVVELGDSLYHNGRRIGELQDFLGALWMADLLVAVGRSEVLLIDAAESTLIDRMQIPGEIRRAGRWDGRVVLDTDTGLLVADDGLLNWQPQAPAPADVVWTSVSGADPDTVTRYQRLFRQRMLTLERLLQDLHSGRLFGTPGILIIDLASVLLLFLATSGLIMWWRLQRRRSQGTAT